MTQRFSAQCCHQESISVTPQPGCCCFLSQKRSSALKNKVLSKKFQEIALGENVLYGRRKRALMSLQRSEPDHIIQACRRGQVKPRGSAFSDSWSDRVWCHYPHCWHCFAHCKLPSPLTLQITTAPFRPGGPGSGCCGGIGGGVCTGLGQYDARGVDRWLPAEEDRWSIKEDGGDLNGGWFEVLCCQLLLRFM